MRFSWFSEHPSYICHIFKASTTWLVSPRDPAELLTYIGPRRPVAASRSLRIDPFSSKNSSAKIFWLAPYSKIHFLISWPIFTDATILFQGHLETSGMLIAKIKWAQLQNRLCLPCRRFDSLTLSVSRQLLSAYTVWNRYDTININEWGIVCFLCYFAWMVKKCSQ